MSVNLATKYESKLDERFTQKSLTEAWCGHDYNWDGTNTIKVWTIGQAAINNYTASGANRFTNGNAPTELDDEVNTYTLARKRSFAHTIDITNNQDQMFIKKTNAVLKQIWDEQLVPEIDMYRLGEWANGAGTAVINSTALTNQTLIKQLLVGGKALNNALVGRDGRVCFVTETMAVELKLASELQYNESFTGKAIVNGQIGQINGMPIVAVPDSYMPEGVEFMIKYKRASADPSKLKMLRSHDKAPGIAGTLIEGLVRYDSFVLAQKAMGIYVYGSSGIVAAPTASLSSSKIALASTTAGATIKYTTDGSNPKTSDTAQTYSSTLTVESGKTLRAYAFKSGMVNSGILSVLEDSVS
ncbi:MAG: chitobiase/beta-hexosaminidase C-terminal domain-containing protein [Oscillospiraceae bacterium]|nr:chitobiase/beta-hexosaminidase C-terminal domain-containing protein [Oscillospiraceae bacterium]